MSTLNSILAAASVSIFLIGTGARGSVGKLQMTGFLGNSSSLKCTWNSSEPASTIIWKYRDNVLLRHDSTKPREKSQSKYTSSINNSKKTAWLEIANITFDDAGPYTCTIFYRLAGTSSEQFTLQVQDRPRISSDRFVSTENDTIQTECLVNFGTGTRRNEIRWFINGGYELYQVSQRINESAIGSKMTLSSMLAFRSDRSHHEKTLVCLIPNNLNLSTSATLLVNYSATVSLPNSSTILLRKAQMNLNITCLADGNPPPTVRLQHWEQEESRWQTMHIVPVNRGNTHEFWIWVYSGAGTDQTFRCYAFNSIGEVAASNGIRIVSSHPVTVEMLNSSMDVNKDEGILISCKSGGNPPPVVYLEKSKSQLDWMTVNIVPFVETLEQSRLSTWTWNINSTHIDVNGTYRCLAFNNVSEAAYSKTIKIEIHALPFDILRDNITLVIILSVGGLLIIILIVAGATKKRDSFQHMYNTIERRIYYDVSNNPTTLSAPGPMPKSSGSMPDVCHHINTEYSQKDNKQVASASERKEKTTYSEIREGNRSSTETEDTLLEYTDVHRTSDNSTLIKVDDESFRYSVVPSHNRDIPASRPVDDDYAEML